MKIICIGQNYLDHIKELNSKSQQEIIFFLKPETAIPIKGQPFFLPDFSKKIEHEIEIVLKINKAGKFIQEKFANRYYNDISLGIDFTARDIQQKMKEKGLPWEIAKSFDGSGVIGEFINKSELNINNIPFSLKKNRNTVQIGNSNNMIHDFDKIISYISKFITLKKGDLIFTGTPDGVATVEPGDVLECAIEGIATLNITYNIQN